MNDNDSAMARELHAAFQQVAPDLGRQYNDWDTLPDLERRLAVRACWQAAQSKRFLEALLEQVGDLDQARLAMVREMAIRGAMAKTGEKYEIIAEQLDALASMDQEAVLDLMDGQPTTLRAALERLLARQDAEDPLFPEAAEDALNALLSYPYPREDLEQHVSGVDVLEDALDASQGFLVPSLREFADRINMQLLRRGYTLVRTRPATVDGIRPHLPKTLQQLEQEERWARETVAQWPVVVSSELLPYLCAQVQANQVHYPHDHGPDGKPRCAGWTWTQAGHSERCTREQCAPSCPVPCTTPECREQK